VTRWSSTCVAGSSEVQSDSKVTQPLVIDNSIIKEADQPVIKCFIMWGERIVLHPETFEYLFSIHAFSFATEKGNIVLLQLFFK